MKRLSTFVLLSFLFAILIGCQSEQEELQNNAAYTTQEFSLLSLDLNLPETPFSYSSSKAALDATIDHIGTFGRVLFYDKNLSADGTVSCANCHQQSLAFSDNKAFSKGVYGNVTQRNSIALGSFNSFGVHYDKSLHKDGTPGLFWDERAGSIKEQLRQTINNPKEMGMELQDIVDLVEGAGYYRILHKKAFDSEEITEDHILEALETFIGSIGAKHIKSNLIDDGNLNYITGDSVTGEVGFRLGTQLFAENCNSCHGMNLNFLHDNASIVEKITVANNGLALTDDDLGVYQHTQNQEDKGKFKIPGLLNVELTAPYMHDGRFASLEEVVDFYNSDIEYSPNLHPALKDGEKAKRLHLSEEEKNALVRFLRSLTDQGLTEEEKWSDPFK